MARARNIKPGFFKNEVLGVADPLYSLLFEGLWVLADREGRLEDRPLRIKGELFPYRDGVDVDAMLSWLQDKGFIRRYEVAGKRYVLVLEFVKHQNPHKNESASEIPCPEEIGTTPEKIGTTRADSLIPDSLNSDSLQVPNGTCPPAANDIPAKPKKYEVPDCPYADLIGLYHELCPTLPRVDVVSDSRKVGMRQRWREVCAEQKYDREQGLAWWRDFFGLVARSRFLTGRVPPKQRGDDPFLADFEWLVGPKNFVKVIEGRYNREAA